MSSIIDTLEHIKPGCISALDEMIFTDNQLQNLAVLLFENRCFFSKFDIMSTITTTSRKGTNAVRKLREQKLRNGMPFMINVKELSTNQCYLEYPNGTIKLITVIHSTRDIDVVRELTSIEATHLRQRFHFHSVK